MSTPSDKYAERVAWAIQKLDLTPVKQRALLQDDGLPWTDELVERTACFYKKFLLLRAKYPKARLAPDKWTDAFWRLHILDTQKYMDDCAMYFGSYLHHVPRTTAQSGSDAVAQRAAFERLQQLYVHEFGTPAPGEVPWDVVSLPPNGHSTWCASPPSLRSTAPGSRIR